MKWQDKGIIIGSRNFSENKQIITLFTPEYGKQSGMVRLGKKDARHQVGNTVIARWQARLHEHLGHFTLEPLEQPWAHVMSNPVSLLILQTATYFCYTLLPEGHVYKRFYGALEGLIQEVSAGAGWLPYLRFELQLLSELGFGIDLTKCAATGTVSDLAYVSPKSGRAVSRQAGQPFADRLLPLPPFMLGQGQVYTASDVREGFALTGHFMERFLLQDVSPRALALRRRLASYLDFDVIKDTAA
jgi:DNA repair protein RecO (recombination protein O)